MTHLVFFGSSDYSVIVLQKLISDPTFSISLIVTKIDKPFGREQIITPNPVAKFAKDHHLQLLQTDEFNKESKIIIAKTSAELGLCVAFGPPFFDKETIDIFPLGIINIHPSPLPRYRGATPGPWQIINGEKQSAVTFFQIDLQPDHGPIIQQIPFDIDPHETADSFYHKAFNLAAENIHDILLPHRNIQNDSAKSYYPKLTKDLAKINWSWDHQKIVRFIRAMQPWPIAWTLVSDKNDQIHKMKVFSAQIIDNKIELQNVLIEGKKSTNWSEISSHYSIQK